MDEKEFNINAEQALDAIENTLEELSDDFDFERKADGIIEIEFTDQSKIIINRHLAAREIWIADRSGGFHFQPILINHKISWKDTRDQSELTAKLKCLIESHFEKPA